MGAIFKREVISFFKNPLVYVVMAIYAFLSSIIFLLFVVWNNTSYLGEYFGFWLFFVEMVVISVLSMKFFSEERRNKTDQLLLTSPISLYSLVAGKFLGAMVVYLAVTAINIPYILIIDIFGTLDYGALWANLLGTLLVGMAMVSIGLFVSSFTESQILAVAGTFSVFFFMYVVNFISGFIPNLFFSNLINNFSLFSRFQDFTNGILSIAPIVYYLSMCFTFLFLTIRSIEKRRWS